MKKHKRIILVISFCVFITLITIGTFFNSYFQLSISRDDLTESYSENHEFSESKLRGTIFDRNGIELSYTVYKDSPQVYYRMFNSDYSKCFSNVIDGYATDKGLDSVFEAVLRMENPHKVNKDDSIGRSVQLTIDAKLQKRIYNLLNDAKNNRVVNGSVVVMKSDGQILSMTSSPGFDIEDYKANEKTRVSQIGMGTTENKAISSNPTDLGVFSPIIKAEYGSADIKQIGIKKTKSLLTAQLAFNSNVPIECDFGELLNSIEFDSEEIKFSVLNTSPMYLAALIREFILGDMIKPCCLLNVVDTTNFKRIIEPKAKQEIIASLSKEQRNKVCDELLELGREFNLKLKSNQTFYGYITKNSNEYNVAGMLRDVKNDENSRIIVLQIINPRKELDFDGINSIDDVKTLFSSIISLINTSE